MTVQQFSDTFGCYIAFAKDGSAQIFEKGCKPPKYMKEYDWYTPSNGHDTTFLPSLAEDYDLYSKRHTPMVVSPGDNVDTSKFNHDIIKVERKERKIVPCKDFKKDDIFEGNITVIEVFNMPDPATDSEKHYVTCRDDDNHDLVWKTKSTNFPAEGERRYMRAKIVGNTESMVFEIPSFEVTGCKFIKEKKC